jgi:hypothetical protein
MKNLSVFIFFMIFGIIKGYSQGIPENANTIIVTVADSNTVKEKIVSVLEKRGYTINSGKTSKVTTTAPMTLKNGTRVTYSISYKGAEVFLTGSLPVAGQAGTKIAYKGNKGTPMMNGWEEMNKIAKEFGGSVKYELK